MSKSNFGDKLYDIFGGIIILIVICGVVLCCSSTARESVKDAYNFFASNDSVENVIKIDSIDVSSSDSISNLTPVMSKDEPINLTHIDTITLSKDNNGNYWLLAHIGDIPMRFMLDTGCSDITISKVGYLYLVEQGIISKNNKISMGMSSLANGDTVEHYTTAIPTLKLGTMELRNVKCSFFDNDEATPLLGQSILNSLGDVTIKYKQNLLLIEH